jgi:hypothetical protein
MRSDVWNTGIRPVFIDSSYLMIIESTYSTSSSGSDSCDACPLDNFAVAVCDLNAVLLDKQQQLLTRAEEAPLKLPPPLPQLNACDFPPSRKRKMTGLEAALQEERDALCEAPARH